jgi:hypothetical protein
LSKAWSSKSFIHEGKVVNMLIQFPRAFILKFLFREKAGDVIQFTDVSFSLKLTELRFVRVIFLKARIVKVYLSDLFRLSLLVQYE